MGRRERVLQLADELDKRGLHEAAKIGREAAELCRGP